MKVIIVESDNNQFIPGQQWMLQHEGRGDHSLYVPAGLEKNRDVNDKHFENPLLFIVDDEIHLHGMARVPASPLYKSTHLTMVATKAHLIKWINLYKKYHGGNPPCFCKEGWELLGKQAHRLLTVKNKRT